MYGLFQPRFGEGGFPIGRLILDRARALRLSRTDLVRRFGYRDLNSGQRALTEVLLTGITPPFIQEKLADALQVDQELLDAVLVATAQQIHDETRAQVLAREDAYRAAFRPHLKVTTERRVPSPIFVAALLGTARLRVVPIPDAAFAASEEKRNQTVRTTIIEHYRERRGHVPAFGGITGYVLVLLPGYDGVDFGLPFNVVGDPAGPMEKVRRLPEAMLGVKRADGRLNGLLKDTPIKVIQVESVRPTQRGASDA